MIIITTPRATKAPTKAPKKAPLFITEFCTIGGMYNAGDTHTKHIGSKDVDISSGVWQAGFDRIDIAPKDGRLSIEEICTFRDTQISNAKWQYYLNPMLWFKTDFKQKFEQEEKITNSYRKVLKKFVK